MALPDLAALSIPELLALHADVSRELRERGVLRTANNPTGDLAEHLFCGAFGWEQAPNSESGFDALDEDGQRYQIKGRQMLQPKTSRQLSALRNLDQGPFDVLAGVLLNPDYTALRAVLVPLETVLAEAKYTTHTNSHRFMLRDGIWALPGVRDVTDELRAVKL